MSKTNIPVRKFDAVIVDSADAGRRTANQRSTSGLETAIRARIFPTRSHTVAKQGPSRPDTREEMEYLWHIRIGVRNVWVGYAGLDALRLVLRFVTAAVLVGYTGWAVQILWRM